MAVTIIIVDENGNQLEKIKPEIKNENWEEECYQVGCKVAEKVASQYLQETEQELFDKHDETLHVKDIKQRTILTRFGEITIQRRLYRNEEGEYCFLLDEYMNWRPNQLATPSLTSAIVDSTTKLSFFHVSEEVEKYTAGVISSSTVHRLLQRVAQDAIEEEKRQHTSWYKDGNIPPSGEQKVPILYMEADGLWIRLQREDKKHYELKSAIAYEGWERHLDDSYSLVNKKVYSHGDDSIPFWQLAGIHFDKYWDLGFADLIVLGGDDADWINSGESEMGYCVRQLDSFHLLRSCCKGWEKGQEIYTAIRNGEGLSVLDNAKERVGKSSEKERSHVLKSLERGKDWRKKVTWMEIPQGTRGLGAMEGNESNLLADRMKDRGMSWRISGAQRMGKAIELTRNGELGSFVGRRATLFRGEGQPLNLDLFVYKDAYIEQASMPVLYGQHASRPWVKVLKEITSLDYPLN